MRDHGAAIPPPQQQRRESRQEITMAFGFTKAQQKQFADRLAALRKADREMQEAVIKYNEVITEAHGTLRDAVEEFEDKRLALHELMEGVLDANTEKAEGMSEKWQETDTSSYVNQWLSDLTNALDSVMQMEQELEEPEELDLSPEGIDDLDDTPLAPEHD